MKGFTLGSLRIDDQLECFTLELPWKKNAQNVSSIPPGAYELAWHISPGAKLTEKYVKLYPWFKWHIQVKDVAGRTDILLHQGYSVADTLGCILVGNTVAVNGYVNNSASAFINIYQHIKPELDAGRTVNFKVQEGLTV